MTCQKMYIIDTNVAILANKEDLSSDAVARFCASFLAETIGQMGQGKHRKIVIDNDGDFFEEYRRYLSLRGTPGIGNAFFKWLWDSQYGPNVIRVSITKSPTGEYHEFPADPRLVNFDKGDRKFVAVANAHNPHPVIVEATDAKWWKWSKVLLQHGITVLFADEKRAQKGCRRKNKCSLTDCDKCNV